jgi:hypothetical protein
MSSQSEQIVWRCSCGFIESDPGACCRKCGTKNPPRPMLATIRPVARIAAARIRLPERPDHALAILDGRDAA